MSLTQLPLTLSDVFSAEASENLEVLQQAYGDILHTLWDNLRSQDFQFAAPEGDASKIPAVPADRLNYFVALQADYPDNYSRLQALSNDMAEGNCPFTKETNLTFFLVSLRIFPSERAFKFHEKIVAAYPDTWQQEFRRECEQEHPDLSLSAALEDYQLFHAQVFPDEGTRTTGGFPYASVTDWFMQQFNINTDESVGTEYSLSEVLSRVLCEESAAVNTNLLCAWFTKLAYSVHGVDTTECANPLEDSELASSINPPLTNMGTGELYYLDFTPVTIDDEEDEDELLDDENAIEEDDA